MNSPLVQLRSLKAVAPWVPQSGAPLVDRAARTVRYVRISLLDRCNLRCTYCRPADYADHVPRAELLSLEEIVALARLLAVRGVDRVRLTGGEPTLRKNVCWLVEQLASIETGRAHHGGRLEIVMTTNGLLLERLAEPLHAAGLAGLTVSADSLDPERFAHITRGGDVRKVIAGIEAARAAGFEQLKLNTVAVEGYNDDELGAIAAWAWAHEMTPRFIETMPMAAGALWLPGELIGADKIRENIAAQLGVHLLADEGEGVRGFGPARYMRVESGEFAGRRVGTIGAMTENFCSSCNRLRVSPRGQLHACLARAGDGDLRAALRGGGAQAERAVNAVLDGALATKLDTHDFRSDGGGGPAHAMIQIGG